MSETTAPLPPKSRKRASNPNRGSKPGERRGGRKPGTPNRVNVEFRETVRLLLETNAETVSALFDKLSWGVATGSRLEPGPGGKLTEVPYLVGGNRTFNLLDIVEGRVPPEVSVSWLVSPEPDKALQRICGLAEYAAPKLTRTEVVGDGGGPVAVTSASVLKLDPQAATEAYRAAIGK